MDTWDCHGAGNSDVVVHMYSTCTNRFTGLGAVTFSDREEFPGWNDDMLGESMADAVCLNRAGDRYSHPKCR